MDEYERDAEIVRNALIENRFTLIATVAIIGIIAFFTHSLHCLWGLVLLANLNTVEIKDKK